MVVCAFLQHGRSSQDAWNYPSGRVRHHTVMRGKIARVGRDGEVEALSGEQGDGFLRVMSGFHRSNRQARGF